MISQRLRGIKADGEAIEEEGFMPKLQELFSSVGISIQDQNGELRSTFDILNDLAGVWDQLSSKQKQYFGEKVAGNRQVKTLNAIMQNWDVVADTIGKATNAEGEALKGNEMYMESVAGKMTQLKSAFQELATTTISSDFVGMFVDLGTALTKAATSAGGLVPILTTILGIIVAIKGVKIAEGLVKIGGAFKNLFTGMTTGLSAAAGWIGVILAIVGVVATVSSAINSSKKSFQDFQQATADSKSELAKEQGKLEELNGELENTKQLISELEGRNLSVVEQGDLDKLYEKNNQLENEIALQKQLIEIREKAARKAAVEEYEENNNTVLGNQTDWNSYQITSSNLAAGTSQEVLLDYAKKNIIGLKENAVAINKEFVNVNRELINLFTEEDHTYLKELEESNEKAEEEYQEAELIIASRIEYIDSLIGDLERVENPLTDADKAFNALFDERKELANLLTEARFIDASSTDRFEMILKKYPEAIEKIKEEIDDNNDWEIRLSGEEAVNEINNIIDSLNNLEEAEAKSKTKKLLSDIYMTDEGAGNVDVLNRKVLHGSDMLEKYKEEFEGFEDDIVTYFSSTYGATIADVPIQFTITPIDKDGNVYSQDEVDEYIQQLIDSSGSIEEFKANDRAGKGLLLHYTPVIDGDFESAENQEALYAQLLHSLSSLYDGDTPLQVAIDEMAQSVSFDNLVRELETKLSMPREEIESRLKEMFAVNTDQINEMKYNVGELGDRLFSSADSKTTKDISEAAKSYKNLTAAMAEQQKAGVLSYETWSKLVSDKGLPGIEKELQMTANGYKINTDTIYDYIKAMNASVEEDAVKGIMERVIAIDKLKESHEELTDQDKENIKTWESEIKGLKAIALEAKSAAGALERYRAASKSVNQDAEHEEGQGIWKTVKEAYKEGKVGTDDFKSGLDFLLGDKWQDKFGTDVAKAYKEAEKVGKKYFGESDSKNAENFQKDLISKGLASYDSTTGKLTLVEKDLSVIADTLQISEDAAETLFGLLNSYSFDGQFEFDRVIPDEDKIEEFKKELDDVTESRIKAEQELAELEKSGASAEDIKEKKKEVEDLTKKEVDMGEALATATEAGEIDTSAMSIDEAIQEIERLQNAIDTFKEHKIIPTVQMTEDYKRLVDFISGSGDKANEDGSFTIQVNGIGDAQDKITEYKKNIEYLKKLENEGVISSEVSAKISGDYENKISTLEEYIRIADTLPIGERTATLTVYANDNTNDVFGRISTFAGRVYSLFKDPVTEKIIVKQDEQQNASSTASEINEQLGSVNNPTVSTQIDNTEADNKLNEWLNKERSITVDAHVNTDSVLVDHNGEPVGKTEAKQYLDKSGEKSLAIRGIGSGKYRQYNNPDAYFKTIAQSLADNNNGNVNKRSLKEEIQNRINNGEIVIGKQLEENLDRYVEVAIENYRKNLEQAINKKVQEQENNIDTNYVPKPLQKPEVEPKPTPSPDKVGTSPTPAPGPSISEILNKDAGINVHVENKDELSQEVSDAIPNEETVEIDYKDKENKKNEISQATNKTEKPISKQDVSQQDIGDITKAANELAKMAEEAGVAKSSIDDLYNASVGLANSYEVFSNVEMDDTSGMEAASAGLSASAGYFAEAYNKLMAEVSAQQSVNVTADTQKAINKINKLSEIKIKVNVDANVNTNVPGNAKGTKKADEGLSLVDEEGAELIEHKSQGTFELGTNNGPRFTQLESGDVVHTASETKKILSRLGSIGGYFRDGLNQAKSIIGNAFGAGNTDKKKKELSPILKNQLKEAKKSSTGDIQIEGSAKITKPSKDKGKKKKSSSSSSKSTSAFEEWAKGLFDWAEIRLERLQTVTDNWLASAVNAIGYIAKNKQLGSAMASVNSQIEATNAAYNLYIQQANEVANQAQLSADIIQKIQNGSIEISSYDEDTQKKISQYQEWYEKALDCVDALQELHEQQKEIAGERLQNIVDDYSNIATLYQKDVNTHNAEIDYAKAIGKELYGAGEILPYGDYQKNIDAEQKVLELITGERNNLQAELDSLMASGLVVAGDENWQKYNEQLKSIDEEFWKGQKSLIDFQDAANNLKIEKIGYQLDALSNSASNMNDEMSLAAAQGSKSIDSTINQYAALRENALQQIDVLESENAVYRQLQQGLEVNSEKYQEYEKAIQDNQKAINSNKQAYEDYHTSLMQLKFDKLKYELDDVASKAEEINDAMSMQQLTGQTGFENNGLISNYQGLIQNAEDQKSELNSQIALYKEYMQAMVDVYGAEATQSTKYLDMIAKIKELEDSYRGLDESIVSWSKDIQNVKVDTISHKIEEITSKIDDYNDKISLMQASGQFVSASNYENMILLTDAEIEKLREQNQVYAEMQVGMDKYSDAYQELQSKIQSNNSAINDLMVSSIGYRDAINQIQIDKYAHQFDLLSADIEKYNDAIKEAEVVGKELTSRFYGNMIRNGEDQIQNLTNQKNAYKALMDSLVSTYGVSAKESDKYKEYEKQYLDLENQIRDTTISIEEWNKAIYDLKTEKIGWQADRTAAAIKKIEESISLFNAQGRFVDQSNYTSMINESAKQIEYLEKQNALYIEQQRGMDVYSSAYQELENKIRSNNSAINDLRVSTEGYKDAINQIKLDKYSHQLDQLSAEQEKYNDIIKDFEVSGKEIVAQYYNNLISNGNAQVKNLTNQRNAYAALMDSLVSMYGTSARESEKYKEYESQLNSLDNQIRDTTLSIKEWNNAIYDLQVEKIGWQAEQVASSIDTINRKISLYNAQGRFVNESNYDALIGENEKQIKYLEQQNNLYKQQQRGMDVYSSAYQELEGKIRSNNAAINDLRISTESYKDAIEQIQLDKYEHSLDNLTASADKYNDTIKLLETTGREITARYYNDLINNGNKQIENLEKQKAEYMSLMKTLVSTYGTTAKETEKYKEYEKQVNSLDGSIRDLTMSIVEWGKSIGQLEIDKLTWRLDELTASADRMNGAMSLHSAQGVDETAKAYKDLIQNGMRQIDILEKQNNLYEQQKTNMDKNSEAYQDIQDKINSNLSTIESIKVSQEGWNDAVVDLGISDIQKYKDAISKTNDEYKRQKELQESIQELEKIATQRKVRTYVEGQGFVYQSDAEELRNAQEKLEEVVSGQLMDKLDDLIDALEESKKDTNVYDANGNLLGQVYNTPNIGALNDILSSYAEKNLPVLNVNVLKDALGKDFASSIGNTSNNNTTALNIGDIIVNEAKDGNALAQAIVDQFPNALLQALYRK